MYILMESDFNNLPLENPETGLEIENVFLCELAMLTDLYDHYKEWSKDGCTVLGKLRFIRGPWHNPSAKGDICGTETVEDVIEEFREYTDKYPFARVDIY